MEEASRPFDKVRRALALGYMNPYHEQRPKDDAEQIACAILYDLLDRRGIKWGFQDIEGDVRVEIVQTMSAYIREGMKGNMLRPDCGDDSNDQYMPAYNAMMKQLRDEYEAPRDA